MYQMVNTILLAVNHLVILHLLYLQKISSHLQDLLHLDHQYLLYQPRLPQHQMLLQIFQTLIQRYITFHFYQKCMHEIDVCHNCFSAYDKIPVVLGGTLHERWLSCYF
ncbi:hypothetical protein AAG570_012575 [Ranatra chinensis]|uniref:Secreted protein n=1 Tax=Ranatra chinensis TaxID=642074 RepID=A0ABD0YE89_9HEMI